jgi:hypothetical protein
MTPLLTLGDGLTPCVVNTDYDNCYYYVLIYGMMFYVLLLIVVVPL